MLVAARPPCVRYCVIAYSTVPVPYVVRALVCVCVVRESKNVAKAQIDRPILVFDNISKLPGSQPSHRIARSAFTFGERQLHERNKEDITP